MLDYFTVVYFLCSEIQWGKKVFSQPPIVQVLPLKKMREACNFHHRYTSTMRDKIRKKNPENHILETLRRSVLLMVAFVTLVPALCRSFTRSPRVVLGFLLTVLVIILTPRGEILRGAPDRGRLSVVLYVFHFLIIAPTVDFFTPSCLPIAELVFPAWGRSTILFLVSFDSSLVLAIVEFGV